MSEVQPILSEDVFNWPEFLLFARKIGIAHELPTTSLIIKMELGSIVRIEHEYQGSYLPEDK